MGTPLKGIKEIYYIDVQRGRWHRAPTVTLSPFPAFPLSRFPLAARRLPFLPWSGNIKNYPDFKHLVKAGLNFGDPQGGLMHILPIIVHKINRISTLTVKGF
jgi:hypothetical protein